MLILFTEDELCCITEGIYQEYIPAGACEV